jgi:hypothetical protein
MDSQAEGEDQETLAALVGLLSHLQADHAERQREWEALGAELKAKGRRLRLVEATVELLQRRRQREPGGGKVMHAAEDEDASREAQVSMRCQMRASYRRSDGMVSYFLLVQAPSGSSAGDKRPRSPGLPDHQEEGPRLRLATALPLSVWQDHLRPLLSVVEAVRLSAVCKALRVMVRGWPMDLGTINLENLESALACFPAAEGFQTSFEAALGADDERQKVELLRQYGGTLKHVDMFDEGEQLLLSAVRAGALPRLSFYWFDLESSAHRQILSDGLLRRLEDVNVDMKASDREQLAALAHLRHLPHLRSLHVSLSGPPDAVFRPFPVFIPPSLKCLILSGYPAAALESVLRDLPFMLRTSGASLEELRLWNSKEQSAASGTTFAQVLRACSSTLRVVSMPHCFECPSGGAAFYSEVVPGLIRCCDKLQVMNCPWSVFRALPAACPSFTRLTSLHLAASRDLIEFTSPLWDLMANGRMPVLAALIIDSEDKPSWGREEREKINSWDSPLVRALEAVAGTLKRFKLESRKGADLTDQGACYELGWAIGKLRRLRYLHLSVFNDGRSYHAVARGLAASRGCPELFELCVGGIERNADWLTREGSLIVPSVRRLRIEARFQSAQEESLLLCCGLAQMGYRYHLELLYTNPGGIMFRPLPEYTRAWHSCRRAMLQS